MPTLREKKEHGTPLIPVVSYEPWLNRGMGFYSSIETHWHDEWEICYIETGHVICTLDGVKYEMEKGDVAFIPGGILHSMEPIHGEHWIFKSVVFSPSLLELNSDMFSESKYIRRFRASKNQHATIFRKDEVFNDRYLSMYEALTSRSPLYEMIVRAGIFELTAYWMKQLPEDGEADKLRFEKKQGIVKQTLDTIQMHYKEKITIAQLAEDASLCEGYFIRVFRHFVGRTPTDYILNYRLTKAAELLRTTDQKILTIAFDTGFNNISFFIRSFEKAFQKTPKEYRKMFGKEYD